jgi:Rrf2 family transcriptional regulator, iron-sulfur cluster assembly transcription factor
MKPASGRRASRLLVPTHPPGDNHCQDPGIKGWRFGDMIRLTKKLLFAIEAVLDIAYNGGQAPVRSSEITERQGIPRRYLEPVLQELVRNKILLGIRGPSGGYRLARERQGISLGDIVRTLRALETAEDPIADPAGSALGHEIVRPLWLDLQEEMMRRLDSLTLEDLCGRAHRAGIAGRTSEYTDFEF